MASYKTWVCDLCGTQERNEGKPIGWQRVELNYGWHEAGIERHTECRWHGEVCAVCRVGIGVRFKRMTHDMMKEVGDGEA